MITYILRHYSVGIRTTLRNQTLIQMKKKKMMKVQKRKGRKKPRYVSDCCALCFLDTQNFSYSSATPVLLREVSYGCTLSPSCRVLNLLKLTSTWLYLHMPMHEGTASYVLRIYLFVYDHSWRLM